ncbi:SDR family NAD(P)-dependent oxidoreductase [Pseudonocardia sp. DSM 110487]|uniref:SDR family NAD(P)-dependent oxidoreductase n=1 Tax=Pseudonocardia sp. DSM 110487 TaxID=2865833 RepID=UPI001C6A23EC|nr:SDR family NAD(P)-dependent oxidoreductase [Pseudonocardia sp. DSM 110487]QYN35176.1 SDR family NAD(P)-dependent oxidoreductase [Pseudonocardia sp. DSM 110487]
MPKAIVTGATSGIGEVIACRLAAAGMTVVLVGRDAGRLDRARGRIDAEVPGADLPTEKADLSLLAEVRDLAARLTAQPPPDVVVSNAAVVAPVDERTPEGLQRTLVTNHLAPYLLLRSLAEAQDRKPARYVIVGGDPRGLARVPVNLDDLADGGGGPLRDFMTYARTKNMNAMFGYALARRLRGTGITVNGAHPGIIRGTGLGRQASRPVRLLGAAFSPFSAGPDAGADTPAWLATAPDVEGVTGRYYVRRRAVGTAPHTTDEARCERLWNLSADLVGLRSAHG